MTKIRSASAARRWAWLVALLLALSASLSIAAPAGADQDGTGDGGKVPCTSKAWMWKSGSYVYARVIVTCRKGAVKPAVAIRAMVHLQNQKTDEQVTADADASTCSKSAGVAPTRCVGQTVRLRNPSGKQKFWATFGSASETYYLFSAAGASGGDTVGSKYTCAPKYKDWMKCTAMNKRF